MNFKLCNSFALSIWVFVCAKRRELELHSSTTIPPSMLEDGGVGGGKSRIYSGV